VLDNIGNDQSKTFISASKIESGKLEHLWDFGNGSHSKLTNPTISFKPSRYKVKLIVTGIGGCKDSAIQNIFQIGAEKISVYPNPVVDKMEISCNAASTSLTTIKLLDFRGKVLQVQTITPASTGTLFYVGFDVRDLKPGNYVIHISDEKIGFIGSRIILKQ
jgi:PKD repeat protein